MNLLEFLQRAGKQVRWCGIALVVLGVLALLAPFVAGLSLVIMIGFLIAGAGLAELALVFSAGSVGRGILLLLLGLLSLFAGGYMVLQPAAGLASLTLFLAAYFVVGGVLELVAAVQARPAPGWGSFAFSAILSILLGAMIWSQFPLSGAWAVGVLVGTRLLLSGWLLIAAGSTAAKAGGAAAGV